MKIDGTRSNDRATELVLAYCSAFNRGDWAGMLALLDDDIEHQFDHGPRESGKPAFAQFLQRWQLNRNERLRDIVVMASPDGARAAAEYLVERHPVAGAGGQHDSERGGAFFSISDAHIRRVSHYHCRGGD